MPLVELVIGLWLVVQGGWGCSKIPEVIDWWRTGFERSWISVLFLLFFPATTIYGFFLLYLAYEGFTS